MTSVSSGYQFQAQVCVSAKWSDSYPAGMGARKSIDALLHKLVK